jgi:hypothetical protein
MWLCAQLDQVEGGYVGKVTAGELTLSKRSFKVVTECPVIVMFLFQLYPRHIEANAPKLLPLMVEAISIAGPPLEHVPAHLKTTYSDLKAAQVKTVSFLTYLPRHCNCHSLCLGGNPSSIILAFLSGGAERV